MSRGFTLIELLLVIGIIATLAGIVIGAVNPQVQLASAQDAKRRANALTIQKALEQYLVKNGSLPSSDTYAGGSERMICSTSGAGNASCVTLESSLVPDYLADLPEDTSMLNANYSGYAVTTDKEGRPRVIAINEGHEVNNVPTDYVGRWPLQDKTSGTTVTATVGNNGTLQGGNTTSELSEAVSGEYFSRAMHFDGTSDTITVPSISITGDWSVSLWVNRDAIAVQGLIGGPGDFRITIGSSPLLLVRTGADGNRYFALPSVNVSTWYNLVITRSGNELRMYLNGTESTTGALGGVNLSVDRFARDGSTSYHDGSLADIRMGLD